MSAARRALALLAVLTGLVGCLPLYLPPVPTDTVTVEPRLELTGRSALVLRGATPALVLHFREIPAEGWLAVQWFGPDNRERTSDGIWLEPDAVDERRVMLLPVEEPVAAGEWRAVVSFDGRLIRQFSLRVAASP